MQFNFKQLTDEYKLFFDLLPQDWQDAIVPFWDALRDSSNIYVIEETGEIVGGGIVFSKPPPDLKNFTEAQQWFDNDNLYIGFLWIIEQKRNNNLGSFWLDALKKNNPNQNYWLLIEENRLHGFYQKNNFVFVKDVINETHNEWLYSYRSPKII